MLGFSLSFTVIVKLQLEVFPAPSVATQLMVVTPSLKVEPVVTTPVVAPEAVQTTLGGPSTP